MEMVSMQYVPVTPQTELPHVRHSGRSANPAVAQHATRNMHVIDSPVTGEPQQHHQQQNLSAPASQESFASSLQSTTSHDLPRALQSSSSNASELTNSTDITSAASTQQSGDKLLHRSNDNGAHMLSPEETQRDVTVNGNHVLASPMSGISYGNRAKRTASGHVKNALSLTDSPTTPMFARGHSRVNSMSSTGSRAGELAHSLKARLSYAMAKVQNGWEQKSFAEVEQLAAHKAFLTSKRNSISQLDYNDRPVSSGLSSGAARMSMHETSSNGAYDGLTSPPSKRHSGAYASYMTSPPQPHPSNFTRAPRLQPPADIHAVDLNKRRSPMSPPNQSSGYPGSMSPPRTPMNNVSRRPATIRTDTQTAEAERDALQALFQLGSPHASQLSQQTRGAASQASSMQGSPLKTEFPTPRRVTFAPSESASERGSISRDGSVAS
ncbi:Hypothetical protein R9X50_00065400 [Acrodontium crateriforme]|uniref:Uncharacterized protein n=1 Tax=Acrodontium crateriforme TaxID=150365 RepID=A0AAQ3LY91_9PEZI|nr:Hypothetical protein R9X50_00065400 [Acrodontium crateriforme]